MNNKIKIGIIDSGISSEQKEYCQCQELYLAEDDSLQTSTQEVDDQIGHGTAVTYLIHKSAPEASLFMVKIFQDQMSANEELFLRAFQFCIEELQVDILHLSNGITYCYHKQKLQKLCNDAEARGIIVVAAFDNFGSLSYPACFHNVIGVDVSDELRREGEFYVLDREDINVLTANVSYHVPWTNGGTFTCNGTSFNLCYITACIANILQAERVSRQYILNLLREKSIQKVFSKKVEQKEWVDIAFPVRPRKAAIFPFNKEIHSLIRFKKNLSFQIYGIYDSKYMGNLDKYAEDILCLPSSEEKHFISNIEKIDWSADFDTFIIGHTKMIEERTGHHYLENILEQCLKHGKSVYLFTMPPKYQKWKELFHSKNIPFYVPYVDESMVPDIFHGKLRSIGRPVLGVFGTSSKQGKFSLQLALRNYFVNHGYRVGQLGTEPSSPLFGFDEVYPIGYESSVSISGSKAIATINALMGKIEDKEPDLILIGSQSQTIPQHTGNLELYVLYQYDIIYGTEPDAVILCVNVFDHLDYVKRTIAFLESVIKCFVIEIALFPMRRAVIGGTLGDKMSQVPIDELEEVKQNLEKSIGKPVFILGMQDFEICKKAEQFFQVE